MAKPKKPAPKAKRHPSRAPAPWFRESVRRQYELVDRAVRAKSETAYENLLLKAQHEELKRENEKAYLHDSIQLLRRFAHGFEARDGYDLREVAKLSGAKLRKVKKLSALIRQEQAQPHVEKVVRTARQRKALESYTGQRDLEDRKRFIVFTEQPEKTRVSVVTPKKTKTRRPRKPRVELAIEVPGGTAREEFFLIEDYLGGEPPETFKDIKKALKKMLPDMPKGYYVLVTSNHGNIGVPHQRGTLMEMIEADYIHYDKVPSASSKKDDRGLAGVVVGFKLVSFTKEGANREYNERLSRRQMLERERRNARKRAARERRARLTGRR